MFARLARSKWDNARSLCGGGIIAKGASRSVEATPSRDELAYVAVVMFPGLLLDPDGDEASALHFVRSGRSRRATRDVVRSELGFLAITGEVWGIAQAD